MGRPSDWWVLDLDSDPTPGDPMRVRELARRFSELSADAFEAAGDVRRLGGESGVAGWIGEAGTVFGGAVGEFPGQLDKLDTSYGMVGRALTTYAGELETAQTQADAALARGLEARGRLETAQGQVAGAETDEESTRTALSTASGVWPLTDVPASWASAPPPGVDPAQVRTHSDAATRLSGLRTQVSDAQSDVDAERALALAAKTLRETAASTCKGEIDRASDAGIQNRSWWDKARDFVADAWDVLVKLAEVVVVVAAIAALVLGGPILWTLVVVAAAVVLADTLMRYANGEASLWDVGFALLNFVPGGKALSLGAGLARGASRLRALGGALRGGWGTVRNMAGGLRGGARTMACRIFGRDPVDVVSGQVVLSQTDVELPGLLPLVLERTHLSTYRHGRHFGPTWASTLDQRLELDTEGACLPLADGTILTYPTPPADGGPVMPLEGVRWPLATDSATGGHIVTDPQNGRTLHFPPADPSLDLAAGQVAVLPLTAVTDRNGHRVDVDRTADGTPTAVRHSGGYHLAVDTRGDQVTAVHLLSTTDGPLRLVQFGYDADGRLTEVVNSSGLPLRLGYDSHGRLTGWTDRNDSSYVYTYDSTGRCVRTTGSDGFLDGTFAYDAATHTTVATDSHGHRCTYVHNSLGQVVKEVDPLGNVTESQWARYDWLLSRTDPLGRTTTYRYDETGNLVEAIRPDGAAATATYDERFRPTLVVAPDGTRWERTFDEHGNLTTTTDPLGATTTYRYDPDRPGHLTSVTDALGGTTQIATNPAGLPTLLRTPTGATTHLDYSSDGRARTVRDPVGGTSHYTWTPEGKITSRTDPDGATEHWAYDGEGNLVEHVDAAGLATRYGYTHFDLPAARTDPDGTRHTFDYDTELRLATVTNPQRLTWTYTYDPAGRLVTETDFDGRTLRYDYDPAGQLVARTNGAGQTATMIRDLLGEVVEERTPSGATSFGYDRAGRVVEATNADVASVFVRDALGRVVAETVDGRTTTSAYDSLGRRIRRVTPSGLASAWDWDADGMPLALRVAGRVIDFAHDAAGRETGRRLDTGLAFAHGWDAAHRLVSQTVTAPESSAARTASGRGRRLVHHRGYTYSPDGYLTAIDDMRHGTRRYTLDPARRVTAVTAVVPDPAMAGAGWRERYAYDQAGNLTEASWPQPARPARSGRPRIDSIEAGAQGDRAYDGTRLRRAGRIRFEYDAQGRVTLRQQKRLSGPPRTWRYSWDADDRLVGVVTPDGQRWRYLYDAFGRRVAKQRVSFDGTVLDQTRFSWDGVQLVEQSHDQVDRRVLAWEWEPDNYRPLAQIELTRTAENTSEDRGVEQEPDQAWFDSRFYAIVTDLVGAPTELLDPDGTLAWQHRTTLWGVPTESNGQNSVDCPLRFPGQYHDPETGLDYNFHRHYDPTTARYTSPDPLGLAPAPNPVTYVSNPTGWIDPLGLTPCPQAIGFAAGEGGSALRADRLQHGTRHLSEAGLLPNWSGKISPGLIHNRLIPILERPTSTFDHVLGGLRVKGFMGEIDGTRVALMVFKEGKYQGTLATAVVPTPAQLANWVV